jgi:hypothetical protein
VVLTQSQKERIALFLRKQDEVFAKLPADSRVQALSQVKQRVRQELVALNQDAITDEQVESVLGRMQISVTPIAPKVDADPTLKVAPPQWSPEKAAAEPVVYTPKKKSGAVVEEPDEVKAENVETKTVEESAKVTDVADVAVEEDYGDRHLLGVCSVMGARGTYSPTMLRAGFLILGCVTGPFVLILYLLAFVVDSSRHPEEYPEASGAKASWKLVRALIITMVLYACAWGVMYGAGFVFVEAFGIIPELNQFEWFLQNDRIFLNCALFVTLPLAMLSGLPLAHKWDRTFALLVNTGLALYAVVLSFGVSSVLVGYTLATLKHLGA